MKGGITAGTDRERVSSTRNVWKLLIAQFDDSVFINYTSLIEKRDNDDTRCWRNFDRTTTFQIYLQQPIEKSLDF